MAGHSKWANIQHRKKAQDSKKGKVFTKLIREITTAARQAGGDVETNPRLRLAVDKALSANMTRDTVDRAIKRGSGESGAAITEELVYEGYGPNGVAVMVECLTDNRNRTVAEVRHAFTKCGGNLGTAGSVAYLFTKTGILHYPAGSNEDKIMEIALDAAADDIITHDDGTVDVFTDPEEFVNVKEVMLKAGLQHETADVTMVASTEVTLEQESAETLLRLIDMLEELDDVQNVYSNADIPEAILEKIK